MDAGDLIAHVEYSIRDARRGVSKLDAQGTQGGGASPKVRHLANNLCSMPSARYLEIGGEVFAAAVSGNGGSLRRAVAVVPHGTAVGLPGEVVEGDFREALALLSGRFNIYRYDGLHRRDAIVQLAPALDDVFVLVIDDWNLRRPRVATRDALAEMGWGTLFEAELPSRGAHDMRRWWNGLFVAVVDRRQAPLRRLLAARLSSRQSVEKWMRSPLRGLGERSPARAIADGQAGLAESVVDGLVKRWNG